MQTQAAPVPACDTVDNRVAGSAAAHNMCLSLATAAGAAPSYGRWLSANTEEFEAVQRALFAGSELTRRIAVQHSWLRDEGVLSGRTSGLFDRGGVSGGNKAELGRATSLPLSTGRHTARHCIDSVGAADLVGAAGLAEIASSRYSSDFPQSPQASDARQSKPAPPPTDHTATATGGASSRTLETLARAKGERWETGKGASRESSDGICSDNENQSHRAVVAELQEESPGCSSTSCSTTTSSSDVGSDKTDLAPATMISGIVAAMNATSSSCHRSAGSESSGPAGAETGSRRTDTDATVGGRESSPPGSRSSRERLSSRRLVAPKLALPRPWHVPPSGVGAKRCGDTTGNTRSGRSTARCPLGPTGQAVPKLDLSGGLSGGGRRQAKRAPPHQRAESDPQQPPSPPPRRTPPARARSYAPPTTMSSQARRAVHANPTSTDTGTAAGQRATRTERRICSDAGRGTGSRRVASDRASPAQLRLYTDTGRHGVPALLASSWQARLDQDLCRLLAAAVNRGGDLYDIAMLLCRADDRAVRALARAFSERGHGSLEQLLGLMEDSPVRVMLLATLRRSIVQAGSQQDREESALWPSPRAGVPMLLLAASLHDTAAADDRRTFAHVLADVLGVPTPSHMRVLYVASMDRCWAAPSCTAGTWGARRPHACPIAPCPCGGRPVRPGADPRVDRGLPAAVRRHAGRACEGTATRRARHAARAGADSPGAMQQVGDHESQSAKSFILHHAYSRLEPPRCVWLRYRPYVWTPERYHVGIFVKRHVRDI